MLETALWLLACTVLAAPLSETEISERLKYYRALSSLDVTFHQTKKIVDAGIEIKSEGRLRLENSSSKAEIIVWEILKPSPVRVTLNSAGVEIVTGSGDSVNRLKFKENDLPKGESGSAAGFRSLGAWLKLDAKELSAEYTIESLNARTVRFTPKTATGPFVKLEMELPEGGPLEVLRLSERSGDELFIRFAKPRVKRILGTKKNP